MLTMQTSEIHRGEGEGGARKREEGEMERVEIRWREIDSAWPNPAPKTENTAESATFTVADKSPRSKQRHYWEQTERQNHGITINFLPLS